jgi:C4-dicarboxylate-binding protein DctP
MKKIAIAILLVVCLVFIAIGCPKPAAPQVITARFSGWGPPPSIPGQVEMHFFDLLKERVGDRLQIDVFQGNTLYNYQEVQLPLKTGAVEMASFGTIELYEWVPQFKVTTLTGAWTTDELLDYLNSPDCKPAWDQMLEVANCIPFALHPAGTFYLWSTKPVSSTTDFNGLRVECGSFEQVDVIKDLGGSGGALPVTDIYTALQQGQYDGAIGTPSIALGFGWPEFVKYVSPTQAWFSNINVILVNKDFWDSLPKDIQDTFKETADETTEWSKTYSPQAEEGQLTAVAGKWSTEDFTISDWDKIINTAQTQVWPDIRTEVGADFFDNALKYTEAAK